MRIRFSAMLATGVRTMVPTLVLFSVFLLVVGHDAPGGGFAGGLLASAALLLVSLAFGGRGVAVAFTREPERIVGYGLAIAVIAGVIGMIGSGTFLTAEYLSFEWPLVGTVKLSSVLLFDVGVYVLVVGLVATALERLGVDR
jgi:multisubunit Na+/H+ antiporter MnhB subunit